VSVREISFGTLFNFRDLGGYATRDRRSIRWGTLYRADGLYRIDDADLERLADLGVSTIFDLRTTRECDERGCFPIERHPASYHHLPMMQRTWDEEGMTADGTPEFFAARYLTMLETGAESIARALDLMAQADTYPAVFHCSAGKDRTGVLAAVVLGVLGVGDDDIADDYSLSGPGVVAMVDWLREHRPELVMGITDQLRPETEAPRDAMLLVLAEVRDRHGSVEGYARDVGVSDETIGEIRRRLLV
jgi:protein-tyrosine phosphatase